MTQQELFSLAPRVTATPDAGPRYTPVELAKLLRLPAPTRQQAEVIAAPVEPLLVVAGAGSGKTETMAARVVWLVANSHVRPEQILGLTFTRKAAGELAHRIRARLSQLVRRLGRDDLIAGEPTVSTYHSYAARVVREHGLRSGYEPAARLLTEAACWQLADSVVRAYDGDMTAVSSAPSTVTDAVLKLAADLAEHLRDAEDISAWTGRFFAEVQAKSGKIPKPVRDVLARQQARLQLLPLVRAYADRKATLGAVDFGDQLARAARVARDHPAVGEIERDRFRVVLLDEYQDTSHAQTVLLRSLFGDGHPVTAVGDPCQSIYGWRGASAGALERFPDEFPRRFGQAGSLDASRPRPAQSAGQAGSLDASRPRPAQSAGQAGSLDASRPRPARSAGEPARELSLTTSWRNRPEILDVANALSRPLRDLGHRVAELAPADIVSPQASSATVHCALLETYLEEAGWLADRVLAAWRTAAGVDDEVPAFAVPVEARPTTAVLVRTRAQIPALESALRSRGLPVDVVGLGGLVDTPEVRDVISTLQVLANPIEGHALLRLLTGPRWRIGPRDLVALYRRARELAAARRSAGEGDEPALADRLDEAVLVEAIDDLGSAERYSEEGYRRFAALRDEFRLLRTRLDQPLPDLIADIERVIGLDVEVAVRPGDAGLARGHLDAFSNIAARFSSDSDGATVGAFLAFLSAAENEERGLAPGEVEVVEGAVQILTAHAAKGLEWDVVAVAGMCEGVFPGPSNAGDHWLRGLGVLPFALRGDRAGLPVLDLSGASEMKGVVQAIERFQVDWRQHDVREERRLAYVAITRPRRLLLASGYWWGEAVKRPRGPSPFLSEIRERCLAGAGTVDHWEPDPPPEAENPTALQLPRASWPSDPLGPRRPLLEEAAAFVRAASSTVDPGDPEAQRWLVEARLLLAERARQAPTGVVDVALPGHLSVSQLVALRGDPARLARTLRRPLPARPDRYARRGTLFHLWLEQRFGSDRLLDLDELPGAADEDAAPDEELAALQAAFEASEWAALVPAEVEVPFATVIAGVLVRGRMDAVYAYPDGRYDVVDWKTGGRPEGPAASAAAIQLAAYRLAWAALAGVPVEQVGAAFYYVRAGVTVRPSDLLDEDALVALVASLPEST
jgi:DNA helicase-2/ATP-dependent DNA helicase PcrA